MIEEKKLLKFLGEKIRWCRKAKGLTQLQLSEVVGISRTYLSEVEHGKCNITVILLFKILSEVGYGILLIEEKKIGEVMKVLEHFSNLTILK